MSRTHTHTCSGNGATGDGRLRMWMRHGTHENKYVMPYTPTHTDSGDAEIDEDRLPHLS